MKITTAQRDRLLADAEKQTRAVAAFQTYTDRRRAFIHDMFDRSEERFVEIMKRTPQ